MFHKSKPYSNSILIVLLVLLLILISNSLHLFINANSIYQYENIIENWFFSNISNLFTGLLFGIILTILIRSSSIVITLIAAMVAAGFPLDTAIFMVFGANVGTTVSSTIVSRFPTCDIHDHCRVMQTTSMHFFNGMLAFIIFFPLQLHFDVIGIPSQIITGILFNAETATTSLNFNGSGFFYELFAEMNTLNNTVGLIALLFILIVFFMHSFFYCLYRLFSPLIIHLLQKQDIKPNMLWTGIWVSALLQSSSNTLLVLLPQMRSLHFTHREFYPFISGINIGTCSTTLIFSLLINSKTALIIAMTHLLYNLLTLFIVNLLPFLKEFPIRASQHLACMSYERASNNKKLQKFPVYNMHKKL